MTIFALMLHQAAHFVSLPHVPGVSCMHNVQFRREMDCVCPVHCGKTADRIQMLFGTVGRTGPWMRQVVGFADRSTERGNVGDKYGAPHCNQWGPVSYTHLTLPTNREV